MRKGNRRKLGNLKFWGENFFKKKEMGIEGFQEKK